MIWNKNQLSEFNLALTAFATNSAKSSIPPDSSGISVIEEVPDMAVPS